MELHEQVVAIQTKEDLVEFIIALSKDLGENAAEWENPTLERYLDAMASWVSAMDGYFRNNGQKTPHPSWRLFGEILYAASLYE